MDNICNVEPVKGIRFFVMSKKDIERGAVLEVTSHDTYTNGIPVHNGLFDRRMGVIEHGVQCKTCGQGYTDCPGHFGYITLAHPIFNIALTRRHSDVLTIVLKILKCVCPFCSKLLIDSSDVKLKNGFNEKTFEEVFKLCAKKKKCGTSREDGCGMDLPKINKEGPFKISLETNDKSEKINWTAADVLKVFKRISDDDLKIMGFDPQYFRPESLILEVLVVPPPSVRPSLGSDTSSRREDDLTRALMSIMKNNNSLANSIKKRNENTDPNIEYQLNEAVSTGVNLLQWSHATMIDNDIPSIPDSKHKVSDQKSRSLITRLKGKDGRIRGNLMGKRVDFSARSVITPDPDIHIDEIGMPKIIAQNLTIPEIVNKYNIEELRRLVHEGAQKYPGAKTVVKQNTGHNFLLHSGKPVCEIQASKLTYGDVVNRYLKNGDPVLFNRQPSLHRMSMMCHKVIVMPGNTFRLNVCVTAPYNADFDGDEMNIHVPESYQTAEELLHLASVPTQIISPRECEPIIAVVQDVCTGLYRMTKNGVTMSPKNAMNLLALNPKVQNIDWKKLGTAEKEWSGRDILSSLLPDRINLKTKTKHYEKSKTDEDRENRDVLIEQGVLKNGAVTKEIYQKQSLGVVQQIFNEYGQKKAAELYNNTQPTVCKWLESAGFSVGVKDILLQSSTQERFKEISKNMVMQVLEIIAKVHEGKFENKSAKSTYEYFEDFVNNILNNSMKNIGEEALMEVDGNNRFIEMIVSGAKGNANNIAQITACVGQQNVSGKRIPYGFDNRTLPHFTKFDDGPESRGFVQSSFRSGLNPSEYFFAAMGGREGLIDSKVRTSETGYIQRRLVKFMEDLVVSHDYSVRDLNNRIIQFLYGNDGMNSTKLEKQHITIINMSKEEIKKNYGGPGLESYVDQLIADKEFAVEQLFDGKKETTVIYPVAFERLIGIYRNIPGTGRLTVDDVLKAHEELDDQVFVTPSHKGNHVFMILARCYLNPKHLVSIMSKTSFEAMIAAIKDRFEDSLITPGEMVGITAAESIGEPSTQLVLNTFHNSGTSAASRAVTGIPRLNEILGATASKKMKTAIMKIKFTENDPIKREDIMNNIRIVKLNNVLSSWRIFYDPFESEVSQDNQFVEMRRAIVPLDSDLSPWLLRIGLDRAKILEYRLTTMDIQSALKSYYNDKFDVMVNDPNDTEIVIRIRIKTFDTESDMLSDLKAAKEVLLNDFVVKGVKNIVYASLDSKEEFTTFNHLTQEFEVFKERFISTEGSNLMEIMGMDGVDSSQVMTNNIMEVYETLGIEAARKLMHAEILNVLGSIYVNHRHISLLIDTMTNNGTIISTTRHGVNKTDANVLAKSSFEENVAQLTNAALFSTIDNMKGVSANVMLGQITPMGTGMTNIYMGTEAAPQECVIVDNNVIMNKNGKENKQTNADVLQMLQNTNDMDFDI